MTPTSQQYASRYLKAPDKFKEQSELESDYLKELTDFIRERHLITNSQLVPIIEFYQGKWFKMFQLVNDSLKSGMLPINPAGFLDLVRSFFPGAYTEYRQLHP